ncbi:MAG: hypothetical protein SGI92_06780 [Bryobacteraceae bacterium]|nr:hypothetical protein [Bryobacteraceae bacterium]
MKPLFVLLATALTMPAQEWSAPVHVLHELKPCVTYRAKLVGSHLIIEAAVQPGWHTFTMDNEKRASEKLAGKPSLGVDQPTRFELTGGLEPSGWFQSEPRDFSKPQLRWFSWGYEGKAVFATKVTRAAGASGPAQIGIRGQACTDKTCRNIDLTLELPLPAPSAATADPEEVKGLIAVRQQDVQN